MWTVNSIRDLFQPAFDGMSIFPALNNPFAQFSHRKVMELAASMGLSPRTCEFIGDAFVADHARLADKKNDFRSNESSKTGDISLLSETELKASGFPVIPAAGSGPEMRNIRLLSGDELRALGLPVVEVSVKTETNITAQSNEGMMQKLSRKIHDFAVCLNSFWRS